MSTITLTDQQRVELELRHLQYTPEERAQFLRGARPFSLARWLKEALPATPEELAEMEEFLKQRERDRESSLANESVLPE